VFLAGQMCLPSRVLGRVPGRDSISRRLPSAIWSILATGTSSPKCAVVGGSLTVEGVPLLASMADCSAG
jgi:hypothetical protein